MDNLLFLVSFLGLAASVILIVMGVMQLRKASRPTSLPKMQAKFTSTMAIPASTSTPTVNTSALAVPSVIPVVKPKTDESKPRSAFIELLKRTDAKLEGKES